ncbi:hypothetical protein AAF712_015152 [Marasmius tenuissimus]|uniref:Uncharacterized protein n=1 Tax=Marasmius tenuissimus TaxID=585030 RepID=A0ABR2ZA72_9AGAR
MNSNSREMNFQMIEEHATASELSSLTEEKAKRLTLEYHRTGLAKFQKGLKGAQRKVPENIAEVSRRKSTIKELVAQVEQVEEQVLMRIQLSSLPDRNEHQRPVDSDDPSLSPLTESDEDEGVEASQAGQGVDNTSIGHSDTADDKAQSAGASQDDPLSNGTRQPAQTSKKRVAVGHSEDSDVGDSSKGGP